VIDLHCHVLPGIDDGPASIEDSLALARASVTAGVDTLVATPHVSSHYPNDVETISDSLAELSARLQEEGIELGLLPGAEIAITHLAELEPTELEGLGLGGGPWLLLEPPFGTHAIGLEAIVRDLLRERRILLAHPERCPAFHRDPEMLARLVHDGARVSLTAGSLVGRFGADVRRFALSLLEQRLVHNVASDTHDEERRPPGIAAELERVGYGALCEWLTEEVPAAILAGAQDIPPRPAGVRRAARPRRWAPPWRRGE
jgi:protein-tyrosine phosphatase